MVISDFSHHNLRAKDTEMSHCQRFFAQLHQSSIWRCILCYRSKVSSALLLHCQNQHVFTHRWWLVHLTAQWPMRMILSETTFLTMLSTCRVRIIHNAGFGSGQTKFSLLWLYTDQCFTLSWVNQGFRSSSHHCVFSTLWLLLAKRGKGNTFRSIDFFFFFYFEYYQPIIALILTTVYTFNISYYWALVI